MRIAFLPADGRPVTRGAFLALAGIGGFEVLTPPVEWLGHLKAPADVDRLWRWIDGPARDADVLIASAELSLYGGLVPSRIGDEPLERLLGLAARFEDARRSAPRRSVLLAATNLRMPSVSDASEEPAYCAAFGADIFAHSFHADRYAQTQDPASRDAAEAARGKIPPAVLADVRARRARNLAVLLALVDLAASGVIDALLIGQDDAAEYGWTRRDLHAVEAAIRERGASRRAAVTYGTDELTARLLARAVVAERGGTPRVRVAYSFPSNRLGIPRYEGQALDQTVTSHVETAGCRRTDGPADLTLFVHNFPGAQEEASRQPVRADAGDLDGWLQEIAEASARGPCGLADVRYANGADRALVARLLAAPWGDEPRAYGGWNTASNTLGMVLAQSLLPANARGRAFTILRLLDDWAYQTEVRQRLAAEVLPNFPEAGPEDLGEAYGACRAAAADWLAREFVPPIERSFGRKITIERVEFPWRRLFHIDLRVRIE